MATLMKTKGRFIRLLYSKSDHHLHGDSHFFSKQAFFQRGDLRLSKTLNDGYLGIKYVEPMKRTRDDFPLTRNPAFPQPLCVCNNFVVKDVQIADSDPGGRQAREVRAACRDGIGRRLFRSTFLSQIGLPSEAVALVSPCNVVAVVNIRAENCPVIQHRIDKQLKNRRDLLLIMGKLSECRRQSAACAVPPDRNAPGVNVEFLRMGEHPFQGGVAVIQRGRERMFWSTAIIHRTRP